MKQKLNNQPAHVLVRAVKKGEYSAEEVLDASLERIRAVEGRQPSLEPYKLQPGDREKVHAFLTLTEERARKQAREVDRKIAAGEDPGKLAGVPFSVKDIFCVQDTPSTAASRILANFVAPYTATPVERLEAAGGVNIGKVNLDEFTYGSSNESSAFLPPVGNPWDPSRVPGGSSGGSAASVAAGECALSLGTDTAGSIRQPAGFCGVVGMKPTYGRVSRYGLIAFASSLDCPGPVARDVTDAALMLGVIAGADKRDATAAKMAVPDYIANLERGVKGMRIGLSDDYFKVKYPHPETGELVEQPIQPEIRERVLHAADRLADAGAEIIEHVPMLHTHYGIPVYFVISRVEAASNLHRYDGVKYGYRHPGQVQELAELYRKSRGEGFGLQPKLRILMGMYVSAAQYEKNYYQQALRARTLIRSDFEHIYDPEGQYRLDCLLSATTPTTAFKIGQVYGDTVLMQYADLLTVPANHAGIPGISVPAGFDSNGLPIGIQFLGRDFDEQTLLQAGRAFEIATESEDWRQMRPMVLRDLS
ncbi:MAG: Asp-tRNA(Asn)/Glu-tRNA(Gln) amidotransferase subunit GatA [Anaerolineales bacterium]|nr:Asp-tRNA(Asn)/Glu-tRNA(Gln) amidotransferase subunit GatA [Anaerolineales bacterium]